MAGGLHTLAHMATTHKMVVCLGLCLALGCDSGTGGSTGTLVPDGKDDNFFSVTAREFKLTSRARVVVDEGEGIEEARRLMSFKHIVIAYFLNDFLVEKENEQTHETFGIGAMVKTGSHESLDVRQLNGRTFEFTYTQLVTGRPDLMERLITLVPSAEMGIPVKTGSDATSAAVRIARTFTGRSEILRCGYHGWHDWCVETSAGVPPSHQQHTHAFRYNDLGQVADLLARFASQVAAMLTMHEQASAPAKGHKTGKGKGKAKAVKAKAKAAASQRGKAKAKAKSSRGRTSARTNRGEAPA